MECKRCKFDNPVGMKFCGNCGNPLAIRAEEEEKKIVTILFADLKGYTALSEHMDPEDVKELMDNIFQQITEIIERHRGFVDKYLGDGVMALFGAPVAHEDDAERAVMAAIEIQEFVSKFSHNKNIPLSLRIGINTGEVIAGHVGKGRARDYTVMGDAVNTAQRLQAATPPGSILVSETTKKIVERIVQATLIKPLKLKGKSELINAYRIEGRLFQVQQIPSSLFVNRNEEVDKFLNYYQNCLANQKPEFCLLLGELGIGKSRLIHEFIKRTKEKAPPPMVLMLQSSFTENVPFETLSNLVKAIFDIKDNDLVEHAKARIENKLTELGYSITERKLDMDFFIYLLGYELEKTSITHLKLEDRHLASFASLGKILLRLSELKPTVIVFEDIDNTDSTSFEFIKYAFNTIKRNPLFFLLSCRSCSPEKEPLFNKINNKIVLNSLNKNDCQKLIKELMQDEPFPKGIEDYILSHVEGNPLFIEEMLKSIKEQGDAIIKSGKSVKEKTPVISIPPSLQAVLTSRIDSLPENEKELLRYAANIGKSFPLQLLNYLLKRDTKTDIQNLITKEYLMPHKEKFLPNTAWYRFRHILFWELIYNSLLKKVKKPLHNKIGQWFEDNCLLNDIQSSLLTAYHYEQAENFAKAATYYEKAADMSADNFSNEDAIKLYDKAIESSQNAKISINNLLLKNAEINLRIAKYDEAINNIEKILSSTKKSLDKEDYTLRNKALRYQSNTFLVKGEFTKALETAEEALSIASSKKLTEETAHSLILLAHIHRYGGDYTLSLKYSYQAIPIMKQIKDYAGLSNAYYAIGVCFFRLCNYEGAKKAFLQAKKICIDNQIKAILPRIYEGLGALKAHLGQYGKSYNYFVKASIAYRQIGHISGMASTYNNLGAVLYYLGKWSKSLKFQKKALSIAQIIGDKEGQALCLSNISMIMRSFGNYKKALKFANQSLSIRKLIKDKNGEVYSLNNIAAILLDMNAQEKEISSLLKEAISISESIKSIEQKSYALTLQAKLVLQMKKYQQSFQIAESAEKTALDIKNNEKILESRFMLLENAILTNKFNYAKKMLTVTMKRVKRLKQKNFYLIAIFYKAWLYESLGKIIASQKLLSKILKQTIKMNFLPLTLKALQLMNSIYLKSNNKQKAEEIEEKLKNITEKISKNVPYQYKKCWIKGWNDRGI